MLLPAPKRPVSLWCFLHLLDISEHSDFDRFLSAECWHKGWSCNLHGKVIHYFGSEIHIPLIARVTAARTATCVGSPVRMPHTGSPSCFSPGSYLACATTSTGECSLLSARLLLFLITNAWKLRALLNLWCNFL